MERNYEAQILQFQYGGRKICQVIPSGVRHSGQQFPSASGAKWFFLHRAGCPQGARKFFAASEARSQLLRDSWLPLPSPNRTISEWIQRFTPPRFWTR